MAALLTLTSAAAAFVAAGALAGRAPAVSVRAAPLLRLRPTASASPLPEEEAKELKNLMAILEEGQKAGAVRAPVAMRPVRRGKRASALAGLRQCNKHSQISAQFAALSPLRNVAEYTSFISAHGRARDSRSAIALFEEMERTGVVADVVCVAAVMAACVRGGQWRRALEYFDGMAQRGLVPNVFVYSSAIAACDKGGEWARAVSLLSEMPGRGVLPNVVCHNCAISALANAGEWQRAVEQLETMRRCGLSPDAISFNSAIAACEKAGRWDQALALLYRMEVAGIAPDAVSFASAIAACGSGGRWERALSLLEEMERRGVDASVYAYNSAIAAAGAAGHPEVALSLFERLESASLPMQADSVTFNAVLDAVAPQHAHARRLWKLGVERGLYAGCEKWDGPTPLLDLHCLSEGAAEAAVRWWLEERVPSRLAAAADAGKEAAVAPTRLELVTGWGKNRARHQSGDLRERVETVLAEMGIPTLPTRNPGVHACVLPRRAPAAVASE